jgi:hypothetical protein
MGISTELLIRRRQRELEAQETPVEVPSGDQLPDGYTLTSGRGGYYILHDSNGDVVEGPSNGKWQGEDGAIVGAIAHIAE